jgi:hypothetical protein
MTANFPDAWLRSVPLLVLAGLSGCEGHEATSPKAGPKGTDTVPAPRLEYELVLDLPVKAEPAAASAPSPTPGFSFQDD